MTFAGIVGSNEKKKNYLVSLVLQCFCRFNKPVIAHQIVAKTKSAQEQLFAFGKFEKPTTRKEGFI